MTLTIRRLFILLIVLLAGVAVAAHAGSAEAANCFYHSAAMGYVCDSAPTLPQFTAPPVVPSSLLERREYAYLEDYVDVYPEPTTAVAPLFNVDRGFFYVTLRSRIRNAAGEIWYEINPGHWVPENAIRPVEISRFHGVVLTEHPRRPFGWILARVQPSSTPGGEPDPAFSRLERYTFFEVFDARVVEEDEGWIWYNIGGDRWIRQTYVSLIQAIPRPAEVGPNEYWTAVDLYEQSFAAYEGDRMVYASVISSGLNRWPTYEGLFQVVDRLDETTMDGAEGRIDYYVVEDVPHTMFFDMKNQIALHGAYWHDRFGYKHSHGCVNMPPLAAEWVYNWSANAPVPLWVTVYTSDPHHYFETYADEDAGITTGPDNR